MTKTVALLIFPGVQALDVSGPLDVFAEANRFLPKEAGYLIEVVGTEPGLIACSNGLLVKAHRAYGESRGESPGYDLLLTAGGPSLPEMIWDDAIYEWLRAVSAASRRFGSICNGAFALARAGLLGGRHVTTHWNDAHALADLCPTASVDADRIFVQDGQLYTSAGVTAGIDLSLFLLAQDHGSELALNVAKRLVVFTQRAGGQSQFSPYLTPYAEPNSPVAQVQDYVLSNLASDLSVPVLAAVAKMSPRNFSRIFARDAKMTPAAFVESARVDAARSMLENGALPLKRISYECGFGDPHNMRKTFQRRFGVSPQEYRANFSVPKLVKNC
ncbi:GlxA family transcriptional regulator [Cupriavidus sp. 2SB]|uniref:GlxA family transcriptional regulator n=1 Tax=Cupriavidus sp. 2SB TaxID=2502199 RepID=UPI0010F9B9B2|nr:GlxA family transcriptional regulator [Cupriavidus sp. 2SB]